MAKKKKQTIVEEPIVEETMVVEEQPKVEAPKTKAKPKNNWVIEDKVYYLKGRMKPLSRSIKSSGVYYFDEYSDGSGDLQFKNPLSSYSDFYLIPKEWNIMTSQAWSITPKKNLLVFFPSYLEHRIVNNKGMRRSLAFNIVPIGEYGSGDSTYNASWFS